MNENIYLTARKFESDLIFNNLNEGKGIDVYGTKGIGKTYLLRSVISRIRGKFKSVYIVLPPVNDVSELLEEIAKSYDKQFDDQLFYNFSKHIDENQPAKKELLIIFRASLHSAIRDRTMLFCFDNTEMVQDDIWEEFEDKILRFHLDTGDGVGSKLQVITAGQQKMRWHFFRMKEQVTPCRLELFGKKSTKEMLQRLADQKQFAIKHIDIALKAIYKLTLGHPKSIELTVQRWTKDYEQALDGYDIGKEYKNNAGLLPEKDIDHLIKQFIIPEIINQVKELKEDIHYPASKSLLSFLQHLMPLRFVSNKVLREVLYQLFPQFYQSERPFFFNKVFRIFKNEYLIEWLEEKERYEFPVIVRHILQEDLKQRTAEGAERGDANELDFIKLHKKMARMYQSLIDQSFVDRHPDFVEKLYHTVSWQAFDNEKMNGSNNIEETIKKEIDDYLREYGEDAASLRSLLELDGYLENMINWENIFR